MSFESISPSSLFFDLKNHDKDYRDKIEKCQMDFLDRLCKDQEMLFFRYMNFIVKEKK